ncbi:flagellar basal-body rod modification protein FlgD [Pseudomonas nitritireducens]|uniref:Basal-body rod modification protein FlgD n=1 Tax=Pseudomonas nitroreducens TaxID=46680 RepID=A0A7W7KM72_PSENT|nr:flagellar hook assembly protein FlgD [Pseudomonas nitritireducens]MBB4865364.1 flagellar basal-body rod modification protein FlgD [Pseudomonas nitritireducens]
MATTIDNSLASASSTNTSSAKKDTASELSANFLTMLMAQLKNQDPTNPMDNSQMTSQLAQINQVSSLDKLTTQMAGITSQINASQYLQATQLIGSGVLVPGNRVIAVEGTTTPIGVDLSGDASSVTISIKNSAGEVVRKYEEKSVSSGTNSFDWDGKLEDGSTAPDGGYTFEVAVSGDGSSVTATALNYALVGSVKMDGDNVMLDLGAVYGQVNLKDVRAYFSKVN